MEPSRLRRRLAGLGTSATDAEMEDAAMSSLTAMSHFSAAWGQFETDELSLAARAPSNSGSNSIAENPQLVHFGGSASSNADRDDNAALGFVPTKGYRVTGVGSTPLGSLAPHVEASSHSSILLRLGSRMGSLLPLLIAPSEAPTPSPPMPSVPSDSPLSSMTVKPPAPVTSTERCEAMGFKDTAEFDGCVGRLEVISRLDAEEKARLQTIQRLTSEETTRKSDILKLLDEEKAILKEFDELQAKDERMRKCMAQLQHTPARPIFYLGLGPFWDGAG